MITIYQIRNWIRSYKISNQLYDQDNKGVFKCMHGDDEVVEVGY